MHRLWSRSATLACFVASFAASGCSRRIPVADVARTQSEETLLDAVARTAKLDAPDRYGRTALHYAAERGFVAAVRMLARDRSRVDAPDADGETPLFLATRARHVECAYELLSAGAAPESHNGLTRATPLHAAAEVGSLAMAQLLLRWGAPVGAANRWGETPLHVAAVQGWEGQAAMAEYLLDHGAAPDTRDARGFSPLQTAAFSNNLPVLRLLLARGQSIDERTPRGSTLLDLALERNADLVAQYLFEHGAPLARATTPLPPLHVAAAMNDSAFAALLLAFGASPGFTFRGETAVDVARNAGSTTVLALLEEAGAAKR